MLPPEHTLPYQLPSLLEVLPLLVLPWLQPSLARHHCLAPSEAGLLPELQPFQDAITRQPPKTTLHGGAMLTQGL